MDALWIILSFHPDADRGGSDYMSAMPSAVLSRHHLPHLLKSRAMPSAST